jgi:magnesium transporter
MMRSGTQASPKHHARGLMTHNGVVIIDCAMYEHGHRLDRPATLDAMGDLDDRPEAFVWIGLRLPSAEELGEVLSRLGFEAEIDVSEVLTPHRRPVLTIEGRSLQLVLRTARYIDEDETITLGEMTLLVRDRAFVSVRHGPASPLGELRKSLEADGEQLIQGPLGVLTAIVNLVVADYSPALDGFENDVMEVEREVFSEGGPAPVRRLYRLKREVRMFQSPVDALDEPFARLVYYIRRHGDADLSQDIDEISDQLDRTVARTRSLSNLIDAALTATLAQVGIQQNEDMRKISAWVAMAAVPTLLAGIYGMNFTHMPELDWTIGYPLALVVMAVVVVGLFRTFKRRHWL